MTVKELYEKAGVKSVLRVRSNVNGMMLCGDYKPDEPKCAKIGDMVVCSIRSKVNVVDKESEYHMYSYLCVYAREENDNNITVYKIRSKLDALYKRLNCSYERTTRALREEMAIGCGWQYYEGYSNAFSMALAEIKAILEEMEEDG